MSTTPRPGDIVRVSYETTVDDEGHYRGKKYVGPGCRGVHNHTVEVIGLADDPAKDPVGTVRQTPHGPAVRCAVRPGLDEWLLITESSEFHLVNTYDTRAMTLNARDDQAPVIGVVPGTPADVSENGAVTEMCSWRVPQNGTTLYCRRVKGHPGDHDFSSAGTTHHFERQYGADTTRHFARQYLGAPLVATPRAGTVEVPTTTPCDMGCRGDAHRLHCPKAGA